MTASIDADRLLFNMLKGGVDKRSRDVIGASIASSLRAFHADLMSSDPLEPGLSAVINKLRKVGYAQIPPVFSPQQIESIMGYFAARPATFYNSNITDPDVVQRPLNNGPAGYRFCEWPQEVISACPEFEAAAHHPQLIRLAEAYLEAPPTITILTTWWSFPSDRPVGGMQHFHHDRDDFRCLKLLIYLTPVTAETGPHEFVDSTHTIDAIMRTAGPEQLAGPALKKFLGWLETHRKDEAHVRAFFPKGRIRTITGASGAAFLEDTRGFHRGVPPRKGPRFAFEICYSLLPKSNTGYRPVQRRMSSADPAATYATRMFYKS